jgi:hypothetical protein
VIIKFEPNNFSLLYNQPKQKTHINNNKNSMKIPNTYIITKKGCTRLAATSDKVYQLLAHGRWFSPGTPASSITKTGRHDIAEILLKVAQLKKNKTTNTDLKSTTQKTKD